jgi:hypothetical protein
VNDESAAPHPCARITAPELGGLLDPEETDEIVASLRPDAAAPLLVATDGTVMDGNTRIYILRDRGYDVDTLPRKLYEP